MRRRTCSSLLAVVLVVAAGCSKSNSPSGSVTPPPKVEKSSAISTADGVCTTFAADVKALEGSFKAQHPNASPAEVREFVVSTLLPRHEEFVGDFHRIGEPTNDRTDWDSLVRGLDNDLTDFKQSIDADPQAALGAKPYKARAPQFTAYGFKQCQTAVS